MLLPPPPPRVANSCRMPHATCRVSCCARLILSPQSYSLAYYCCLYFALNCFVIYLALPAPRGGGGEAWQHAHTRNRQTNRAGQQERERDRERERAPASKCLFFALANPLIASRRQPDPDPLPAPAPASCCTFCALIAHSCEEQTGSG